MLNREPMKGKRTASGRHSPVSPVSMLNREPMKGKHANIIAKPFHTMPRHFGALAVLCQLSTPCVLKAEWPNLSLEGNSIRF